MRKYSCRSGIHRRITYWAINLLFKPTVKPIVITFFSFLFFFSLLFCLSLAFCVLSRGVAWLCGSSFRVDSLCETSLFDVKRCSRTLMQLLHTSVLLTLLYCVAFHALKEVHLMIMWKDLVIMRSWSHNHEKIRPWSIPTKKSPVELLGGTAATAHRFHHLPPQHWLHPASKVWPHFP